MSEKLELISFKLCPFVQRAVVTLKQKNIDFDITYVDLNDLPDWFMEISPLGQVPVLKVGKDVLFESSVIQEYVDEVTPPSLHPEDVLQKAKNRAWMAFGGELMPYIMQLTGAEASDYKAAKKDYVEKLTRLEQAHSGDTFFNDSSFNLIDAAYAPLFMRMSLIKQHCEEDYLEGLPKLSAWSDHLLEMESVKSSVVDALPKMFCGMIKMRNGFLATQLKG